MLADAAPDAKLTGRRSAAGASPGTRAQTPALLKGIIFGTDGRVFTAVTK